MASVYWLRLPEHTDIFTQGYVGVTTQTIKKRFEQHLSSTLLKKNLPIHNALRKYRDVIVVEEILIGETDYVYDVEEKLRPEKLIGWNCAVGGDKSSIGRIPIRRSEAQKQKMRLIQKKIWENKPRNVGSGTNHDSFVWSIADKIYADRKLGLSGSKICKKYGIEKLSNIHVMIYVHFKNGWNPLDDPLWLDKYKGGTNEKAA